MKATVKPGFQTFAQACEARGISLEQALACNRRRKKALQPIYDLAALGRRSGEKH